jgi:hypothetical protein
VGSKCSQCRQCSRSIQCLTCSHFLIYQVASCDYSQQCDYRMLCDLTVAGELRAALEGSCIYANFGPAVKSGCSEADTGRPGRTASCCFGK